MDEQLKDRTTRTTQEFARLSGQQCFYLPGKAADDIRIDLTEGACPTFCYEIAKSSVGGYLCLKKRQALVNAATERKEPVVAICHAGLFEIMAPALSGAELEGVFNACFAPVTLAENIRGQIDLYQKKYGVSEGVLLEALGQIAPIDENAIPSVKNLLNALIAVFGRPEPPTTEGNASWPGSSDLIDDDEGEEITTYPVLSKPFSLSRELLKNAEGGYQAADDILQKRLGRIFADIRTGNLVRAKENFKAIMNTAYLEEVLERAKFAAQFIILRMNDNFLRKFSFYDEVYDLSLSIFTKIGLAHSPRQIREIANEYFDGMTEIYRIKDQSRYPIISRIVHFVDENYGRPFTIKDMAKTLNVSTSYASRTFSDQMGVSIKGYVNEIRMYHAQYLIRSTDWPVSVVAERVGYPDVRSFYKMFEKHFGVPCTHLRRLFVVKPVQKREESQ